MYSRNPPTKVGETIPEATDHAVSVTLPTWAANVAYEEGEDWVASVMRSGYPRFKIHYKINELEDKLLAKYGKEGEKCMVFPTFGAAKRCREFVCNRSETEKSQLRIVRLSTRNNAQNISAHIAVLFFPADLFSFAKQYWQHTGEGVSSRRAQYFLEQNEGLLDSENVYVEERFGRNLDLSRADDAKLSLRKRLAMQISNHSTKVTENDVYLFPTGMAAIFNAHRLSQQYREGKTLCFGFPYTDSLKIFEKWGPGVIFKPLGNDRDLDEVEKQLENNEIHVTALFCEFPSNPLLKSPDLIRIRKLADKYDFLVIVDDTVGNILNIDVLPYVDVCVCSLTKIFSGDCNVMGGDIVLNPKGRHYEALHKILDAQFEDMYWAEDAIYLERNSRDFVDRNHRTNSNAEAVVKLLEQSPIVSEVYYPSTVESKGHYDAVKLPDGGYGGLLSVVFKEPKMAIPFFDSIKIAKGPSLGTNFTLACPYTIIAHYCELDFVESCGVSRYLVRISIGLEETDDLLQRIEVGLKAAAES